MGRVGLCDIKPTHGFYKLKSKFLKGIKIKMIFFQQIFNILPFPLQNCTGTKCFFFHNTLIYHKEESTFNTLIFQVSTKVLIFRSLGTLASLDSDRLNPFSPKRQFFDGFFEFLWTQATLLIIIKFHSNLRKSRLHQLSGEKTKLVYNCLFTIVKFFTKKRPKSGAHC